MRACVLQARGRAGLLGARVRAYLRECLRGLFGNAVLLLACQRHPTLTRPASGCCRYGAETFGKLVSLARGPQQQQQQRAAAGAGAGKVMDRAEILASIRADYDEQYFVRGVSEMSAYDPQCVFAGGWVVMGAWRGDLKLGWGRGKCGTERTEGWSVRFRGVGWMRGADDAFALKCLPRCRYSLHLSQTRL